MHESVNSDTNPMILAENAMGIPPETITSRKRRHIGRGARGNVRAAPTKDTMAVDEELSPSIHPMCVQAILPVLINADVMRSVVEQVLIGTMYNNLQSQLCAAFEEQGRRKITMEFSSFSLTRITINPVLRWVYHTTIIVGASCPPQSGHFKTILSVSSHEML